MKKFTLNQEKLPLGELELRLEQFDIPRIFRVDFSKAVENKKTEYNNGERHILDETASIIISGVDDAAATALEKVKISASQLEKTEIELVGGFDEARRLMVHEDEVAVKLKNPRIYLKQERVAKQADKKWVSVYAWNSVKLVADGFEVQMHE